ncbi:MAG: tetratricopeptide repeat protein [Candidatus Puniceispirillales bacterium]
MILTGLVMLAMMAVTLFFLAGVLIRDKSGPARITAGIIPLAVIIAVGLYAVEGEFGRDDAPLSGRSVEIAAAQKEAATEKETQRSAVREARARVIENPDDIEARFALAEAAAKAGESALELQTLEHILSATGDPALHAMIAEALTREADGIVTLKALEAIERGLDANPDDWRARYFKGLYLSQNDDDPGALDIWVPLAEDLFGSPIYPAVVAAIEQSADRLGLETAALLPEEEPPMTAADISAMVGRLEERLLDGDTHEEREAWLMLIRSLMILDDSDRRDRALDHYLTLDLNSPEDSATIIGMAEIMLPPDNLPEKVPAVLVGLINKARELTPAQPSVLFFSGLVARQQGDRATILETWGRLREMIEDENPLAALLDAEIKAAGN